MPKYSIISASKTNSYGHPHDELLKRLDEAGSEYMITYECGAITILTDGEKMKIRRFLEGD